MKTKQIIYLCLATIFWLLYAIGMGEMYSHGWNCEKEQITVKCYDRYSNEINGVDCFEYQCTEPQSPFTILMTVTGFILGGLFIYLFIKTNLQGMSL